MCPWIAGDIEVQDLVCVIERLHNIHLLHLVIQDTIEEQGCVIERLQQRISELELLVTNAMRARLGCQLTTTGGLYYCRIPSNPVVCARIRVLLVLLGTPLCY